MGHDVRSREAILHGNRNFGVRLDEVVFPRARDPDFGGAGSGMPAKMAHKSPGLDSLPSWQVLHGVGIMPQ